MNRDIRPPTKEGYIGNFLIFLSNAFLIGIGGLPWGAFVAYFGVLTFFVTSLGYGGIGIPLVNAIFWLGFALPQLPAAYFLEANPIKKNWLALLQLIGSVMFLVFGIFMIIVGDSSTFAIFLMFIVFYSLGCLATGSSAPLNYALLYKIVPAEKLGKLLGIFFVSTTFASIIGGGIVTKVLGRWPVERSDANFSLTAYKVLFMSGFLIVLAGSIMLLFIREKKGEKIRKKENFITYLKVTFRILGEDKNLTNFIIAKNLMFGFYVTFLFFAQLAASEYNVAAKNAGLFIAFYYGGMVVAGLTLARLADRYGPRLLLVLSQILALAAVICAVFAKGTGTIVNPLFTSVYKILNVVLNPAGLGISVESGFHNVFYFVFFIAGVSQICDNVGYSNMCFLSCPIEDKTTYIGLINLFVFILPVIMPFVFGGLVSSGVLSIKAAFLITGASMIIAMLWILFKVDNPAGFKNLKEQAAE